MNPFNWNKKSINHFSLGLILLLLIVNSCSEREGITKKTPPKSEEPAELMIFARQFTWTVWYPGEDKKFGQWKYDLITDENVVGKVENDPHGLDDIIIDGGEFHLIKNIPYRFKIISTDVIHSLYLPHFRRQQQALPGLETSIEFTPERTTEEMHKKNKNKVEGDTANSDFNYIMICNKICGVGHYEMNMTLIVDEEKEFLNWWSSVNE